MNLLPYIPFLAFFPLPAAAADAARQLALLAKAKDPYRILAGRTNSILADGFVVFGGKVLGTEKGGIRLEGDYAPYGSGDVPQIREFFVAHFPYQVADDDQVGLDPNRLFLAKLAGVHRYTTAIGGSRIIHALDYGIPCAPPAAPAPRPRVPSAAPSPGLTNCPPTNAPTPSKETHPSPLSSDPFHPSPPIVPGRIPSIPAQIGPSRPFSSLF